MSKALTAVAEHTLHPSLITERLKRRAACRIAVMDALLPRREEAPCAMVTKACQDTPLLAVGRKGWLSEFLEYEAMRPLHEYFDPPGSHSGSPAVSPWGLSLLRPHHNMGDNDPGLRTPMGAHPAADLYSMPRPRGHATRSRRPRPTPWRIPPLGVDGQHRHPARPGRLGRRRAHPDAPCWWAPRGAPDGACRLIAWGSPPHPRRASTSGPR